MVLMLSVKCNATCKWNRKGKMCDGEATNKFL